MRITLSGATGFLGRHLIARLATQGHELQLLTRRPVTGLPANVETVLWNPPRVEPPPEAFAGVDAVIHLAGATVNQRWTESAKVEIRTSRLDSTRAVLHTLSTLSSRPALFLSASAIGIYGDRGEESLDEDSKPGSGLLADLTVEWEREANLARSLGMRVNCLRTGVVLGREGGALAGMLPPFRFGAGGKLGHGQQWMSWIHIEDWVSAVEHLLKTNPASGPVNLSGPMPVRNADFTHVLGKVLRRPAFFTVPEFALKLVLGEMSTLLLASQKVMPKALTGSGFSFRYPGLETALRSLLQ